MKCDKCNEELQNDFVPIEINIDNKIKSKRHTQFLKKYKKLNFKFCVYCISELFMHKVKK